MRRDVRLTCWRQMIKSKAIYCRKSSQAKPVILIITVVRNIDPPSMSTSHCKPYFTNRVLSTHRCNGVNNSRQTNCRTNQTCWSSLTYYFPDALIYLKTQMDQGGRDLFVPISKFPAGSELDLFNWFFLSDCVGRPGGWLQQKRDCRKDQQVQKLFETFLSLPFLLS